MTPSIQGDSLPPGATGHEANPRSRYTVGALVVTAFDIDQPLVRIYRVTQTLTPRTSSASRQLCGALASCKAWCSTGSPASRAALWQAVGTPRRGRSCRSNRLVSWMTPYFDSMVRVADRTSQKALSNLDWR
jgi:hypothetical protein